MTLLTLGVDRQSRDAALNVSTRNMITVYGEKRLMEKYVQSVLIVTTNDMSIKIGNLKPLTAKLRVAWFYLRFAT